jgi:2-C-methyl-D-erythritol 4-phosphate cytidylyltransferase
LKEIKEEAIIFVHDAVRCMVSKDLVQRCYEQAIDKGSAIPAVAATDSIRIEDGDSHHIIDRNKVRIIQTPQTFKSNILLPAFTQDYKSSFTDEASVVEESGSNVYLIQGEETNIKITRPIDMIVAEAYLKDAT